MQLKITGKNIDVGEALSEHVTDRVEHAVGKLFNGEGSGHVTFEREGQGFKVDCSIHLDSGIHLQSSGSNEDAYKGFDQAADRIEKRLRRYKRRLKNHHNQYGGAEHELSPAYVIETQDDADTQSDENPPIIVAEYSAPLMKVSVSTAVMQLDLTDRNFLLFRNASHGGLNIVYKRDDGNIGWLDPDMTGQNT
ncbi:MAG: ribosome-associated translation inhibitor RaiA [Fimbriimonadaceae bacterium]|nr:ribosome-associated translation inhibitor RaiA [Alphaproteobacteria bacterium]